MKTENSEFQNAEIVKFNQTQMVCPVINGEPYVIAKSIIDGIGLEYENAMTNLRNSRFKTYTCEYKVMSDKFHDIPLSNLGLSFGYSYLAIPVRKVAAWLYSIQTEKVKEPARSLLIKFQDKCDEVLFQYFFGQKKAEQTYFDDKKELLMQKRALDTKIKNLKTIISGIQEGKELKQAESELKTLKSKINGLERKQLGMIYSLFDQLPENKQE